MRDLSDPFDPFDPGFLHAITSANLGNFSYDAVDTFYIQRLVDFLPFDPQKHVTHTPIPPLLLEMVCGHLADIGAKGTLRNIQSLSKLSWNIATPWIYTGTVDISRTKESVLPGQLREIDQNWLRANLTSSTARPFRDDFNIADASLYQLKNLGYMSGDLRIISWPSTDLSAGWTDVLARLPVSNADSPALRIPWSIKRIKVEASAIHTDGGSLGECRAFLRSLRSLLSPDLEVCVFLPASNQPWTVFDKAEMCAEVLTSAKMITFHEITTQALPFGQVGTTQYRYFWSPASTARQQGIPIAYHRIKQIRGLFQEIRVSSSPSHTVKGRYRISGGFRIELIDDDPLGNFKSNAGWLCHHLDTALGAIVHATPGFMRVMKRRTSVGAIPWKQTLHSDGTTSHSYVCPSCKDFDK